MDITSIHQLSLMARVQYGRVSGLPANSRQEGGAISTDDIRVDSVELSIKLDVTFIQGVLQASLHERLNKALDDAGIEVPDEVMLDKGQDWTPEATAQRIVDFATGFIATYQQRSQSQEDDALAMDSFVYMIKDAVEQGFAEARQILEGFQEMDKELWKVFERTYLLVLEGIEAFAASRLTSGAEEEDMIGV